MSEVKLSEQRKNVVTLHQSDGPAVFPDFNLSIYDLLSSERHSFMLLANKCGTSLLAFSQQS
jgi:hypothetical protein